MGRTIAASRLHGLCGEQKALLAIANCACSGDVFNNRFIIKINQYDRRKEKTA